MASTMITPADGAVALAAAPSPHSPGRDASAERSGTTAPARHRRFGLGRNVDVVPARPTA
jgi:hypothetical protein